MNNSNSPFEIIKKCSSCTDNYSRDWSLLPADILSLVSSKLAYTDYISFKNVCTAWQSARGKLCDQMPFLLVQKQKYKRDDYYVLININTKTEYNFELPAICGRSCVGSQDGWLIVVDTMGGVISLYNPLAKREVKLPSHAPVMCSLLGGELDPITQFRCLAHIFSFKKVVVSSVTSGSSHPAAVALLHRSLKLMCTRDGEDGWRMVSHYPFKDVFYWREHFVVVDFLGVVYRLHLDEFRLECMSERSCDTPSEHRCSNYLVDLDGDLLQVWRKFGCRKQGTCRVEVRKLDPGRLTWERVNDLGSHSLFLGTSHSAALSSRQIPGLKDNLIYFTGDWWGKDWFDEMINGTNWNRDVGVFDMRKRTYDVFCLPATPVPPAIVSLWFSPLPSELQNVSFKEEALMRYKRKR